MDFKTLLNQFGGMLNQQKPQQEPVQDTNPCFYPEPLNSGERSNFSNQQVSSTQNFQEQNNQSPLNGMLGQNGNISSLLPLFSLLSGNKMNMNSLLANTASLSPELSKYKQLIELFSKKEDKVETSKLPDIDSLKRIDE